MAGWTQTGTLKGPTGNTGAAGVGVQSATINGAGQLVLTLTNTTQLTAGLVRGADGARGADGTSVTIQGSVANASALPATLGAGDNGDGYITTNDGHLHVWDGDSFNDVGSVRGPAGAAGANGVGVASALVNGSGRLIITLTNATTVDAGVVKGVDGTNGVNGTNGTNGIQGIQGPAGARGTRWFTGNGAPTGTISGSAAGDFYLDRVTGVFYELS